MYNLGREGTGWVETAQLRHFVMEIDSGKILGVFQVLAPSAELVGDTNSCVLVFLHPHTRAHTLPSSLCSFLPSLPYPSLLLSPFLLPFLPPFLLTVSQAVKN